MSDKIVLTTTDADADIIYSLNGSPYVPFTDDIEATASGMEISARAVKGNEKSDISKLIIGSPEPEGTAIGYGDYAIGYNGYAIGY